MKCKPWIRHFQPRKFQCFSSQFALHGLRALDKLFALVNVQMALGQTAGCPRVNRARKFMCSPRNTGNINFSLWLTGGLSQGCPDFQKVYVFKVYVPFSCPRINFSITFSLQEKYVSAEIFLLYITLSWPQPLNCSSCLFTLLCH